MHRSTLFILLLTSCAAIPSGNEQPLPSTFDKQIEEIIVEPSPELEKYSIKSHSVAEKIIENKKLPFSVGEKIFYDVKFMGIYAGELAITVPRVVKIDGKLAYNFYGTAKTSKLISYLYSVNDDIESYVSVDEFKPIKHVMHLRETNRFQYRVMIFDQSKNKIFFYDRLVKRNREPRILEYEQKLEHDAMDAIGVFYWLRFQEPVVGKDYYRYVFDNGKFWLLKATVLRKEEINTPAGKFKTFVVKPYTYHNGVLKQKADALIWVSDDERRIPVKMEAKVKFGRLSATIKEAPQ